MMNKEFGYKQRLEHMLAAANDILGFTEQVSDKEFGQNRMMQFAWVRGFEILGEAANHVSPTFQEDRPYIEWHNIIGMRNFAAHHYFDVQHNLVLETAQQKLPTLKNQLEQVLRALSA